MINFSLFLNTRKRVELLSNLLESIVKTTHKLDEIELLIYIDDDDQESAHFLEAYTQIPSLKILSGERPQNISSNLNKLAATCKGDFLFVLNDDVKFLTPDWDSIILEQTADIKNQIYLIVASPAYPYPEFPILTKRAYEALGFFFDEELPGHYADLRLWNVFNAIGRVKHVPVSLEHHRPHDEVTIENHRRNQGNGLEYAKGCVAKDILRLKQSEWF